MFQQALPNNFEICENLIIRIDRTVFKRKKQYLLEHWLFIYIKFINTPYVQFQVCCINLNLTSIDIHLAILKYGVLMGKITEYVAK